MSHRHRRRRRRPNVPPRPCDIRADRRFEDLTVMFVSETRGQPVRSCEHAADTSLTSCHHLGCVITAAPPPDGPVI